MSESLACGEAVVASLATHGVEVVFGIPGTHNLPIYDHLSSRGLRHVTPRHEQGAGYAADGYARATGMPGVCLVTTGPGVTNIATAAATAYHDSVPLLIISPGMPDEIESRDTGYLHEVKSQSGAMGNLVHWSRRVETADAAMNALHDAFRHFAQERPRPVHVEIPLDVLSHGTTTTSIPIYRCTSRPRPHPSQVEDAVRILRSARRPAMILGGGAVSAAEGSSALAERLDAVVITTCNGKGTVPEDHPLSAGCSIRFKAAREELACCDAVIAVGTELGESDLWGPPLELSGSLIRIDIDAGQLQKNARSDAPILGDAALSLTRVLDALGDWTARTDIAGRDRASDLLDGLRSERYQESAPYRELHVILNDILSADAIVAGDSSRVSYFGTASLFVAHGARSFLYPTGYSTLGYGIPAAIGAQIGRIGSQTVAVVGDGAAMFSIAEIVTAAELGLPLPIIIINDGGYGQIRASMLRRGSPPIGVDLRSPDFPALGIALGGAGLRLKQVNDLYRELPAAFERNGPTVIEIRMEE